MISQLIRFPEYQMCLEKQAYTYLCLSLSSRTRYRWVDVKKRRASAAIRIGSRAKFFNCKTFNLRRLRVSLHPPGRHRRERTCGAIKLVFANLVLHRELSLASRRTKLVDLQVSLCVGTPRFFASYLLPPPTFIHTLDSVSYVFELSCTRFLHSLPPSTRSPRQKQRRLTIGFRRLYFDRFGHVTHDRRPRCSIGTGFLEQYIVADRPETVRERMIAEKTLDPFTRRPLATAPGSTVNRFRDIPRTIKKKVISNRFVPGGRKTRRKACVKHSRAHEKTKVIAFKTEGIK